MSQQDITRALEADWPGALWTLRGDTYDDLEWQDPVIPKPTEPELDASIAKLPPAPPYPPPPPSAKPS
jgi:hypothetical protein